ncbi:sigma-70 family RNA polymerase sigma factor [Myroides marinus]|uniref:RNA polymerase sigma-70 factor, ECF subfamily n=1 Tax=Myroides marinus TaxID=703342 RepID=A0A164AEV3_9FLAO|nr:sigma-70 family RNA polymerase sigma factor [Myroides marinus]KUF42982.1 RNA polymerase subunit sigma-24 [Myroides marinus]KZE83725.1 RNA polymerase subunit sigma-24 [Myroides marinus]MDM1347831.1 sigma-70 family RNA polymerase sigma factor [Myroides marinus]MDM1351295.1 sigma-70 family RNA polymerase sigma factor [Myroides marinus]MDM1356124.1 sigma-70 family RNA polymerase sigma factor [Myroides marinus]
MVYLNMPDATLVNYYIAGGEEALEVLIKRHQSKIYGFIFSKVSDAELANDIFQDTFIKVINTLKSGRYNEEGKFLPWVIRIAHNLVMDHYRKEKRVQFQYDSDELPIFSFIKDDSNTIEGDLIQGQIEADLHLLLKELPEDQRQVITMRMYQDLSFKEIAEQTDVSINTALGRMRYALLNLRKLIDEKNIILTEI